MADHYGFLPKACAAYRAKTKGKVERPYRYIRADFFLGRTFRNLDDLNAQLAEWLANVANARLHATTNEIVAEAFAAEQPHLKPLPAGPYKAVLHFERRITRDGMISIGGNLYSVPDRTRRRPVEVHQLADACPSSLGRPRPAPTGNAQTGQSPSAAAVAAYTPAPSAPS